MTTQSALEDFRPPTKVALAAMWSSLMFLYVYGDYFYMYTPGKIEAMSAGRIGPFGVASESVLLGVAMMMAIPSLMIVLSLLLPPVIGKWLNVLSGLAYTIILALTLPGAQLFYLAYGGIEIALTLLITWTALRWPRRAAATLQD
ncbi:MAG: DUF6326 family protein [Steroidobacteraceae bacterium]